MKMINLFTFFLITISLAAQNEPTLFSKLEFIEIVSEHHPILYQAYLLNNQSKAIKLQAKGNFDPKVYADWDNKQYDNKNYYSTVSSSLKIPTWYGIELKAAYNNNRGEFLNSSQFIPEDGLWALGIEVLLGKGLVLDQRRATLKEASIFIQENKFNQQIIINDLLFNAELAYLNWQEAYENVLLQEESLELANNRLSITISSFENGDKPSIDTLESFISVQQREQNLLKSRIVLNEAKLELNNFLWQEGQIPLELTDNLIPDRLVTQNPSIAIDSIHLLKDRKIENHPYIQLNQLKLNRIDLERKLAIEELKPDVRISYNPLNNYSRESIFSEFQANDYSFGASVSYSLLQRKARGKLQETKFKEETASSELALKRQGLLTKLNQLYMKNDLSIQQFNAINKMTENYQKLLEAEQKKFSVGESSIFLLNSREVKFIENKSKEIELLKIAEQYRLWYMFESMSFTLI